MIIIFTSLYKQTVEIFCLNSYYMRRSDTIKSCSSFILLPSLLPLLQVYAFLLTVISACIRPVIQIIPSKASQEYTTILQLKVHVVQKSWTWCLRGSKELDTHPSRKCTVNLALLVFPYVCNARSLYHQFFSTFFHEVRQHKIRKVTCSDGLEGLKKSPK